MEEELMVLRKPGCLQMRGCLLSRPARAPAVRRLANTRWGEYAASSSNAATISRRN
jgi:EAL domain-containing protein (putative c-di-GMP-specific phosphodiesterase class I)